MMEYVYESNYYHGLIRYKITRQTEKTIWFSRGPEYKEFNVLKRNLGDLGGYKAETEKLNEEYRLQEKYSEFCNKLDQLKKVNNTQQESIWDAVLAIDIK